MNILRARLTLSVLGVVAIAACGNSSSKSDAVAVCQQNCSKAFDLCAADAGALGSSIKTMCETSCTTSTTNNTATCTNASAVIDAIKACQSKTTCSEYTTCLAGIPRCTGGGTGGASGLGTGGRSGAGTGGASGGGTGGASGGGTGGASGGGATCADLSACCSRVADALPKQICSMQLSTVQSRVTAGDITQEQADLGCAQVLTIGKSTYCP